MINFDFWHGETVADIAGIDCCFYPNTGEYRGNIYNKDNRIIGDYNTRDSVELEKMFPGIFGE